MPGQAASIPVDPNPQSVFVTDSGHRGPERSASPIGKPQQCISVVFDRSARNDLTQFRGDFSDFKTGDKPGQLVRVRSQVEQDARIT